MKDSHQSSSAMSHYIQQTDLNPLQQQQNYTVMKAQTKQLNLKRKHKIKHKKYFSQFPDPINSSIYVSFMNNDDQFINDHQNSKKKKKSQSNYTNRSQTIGIPMTHNRDNKTSVKNNKLRMSSHDTIRQINLNKSQKSQILQNNQVKLPRISKVSKQLVQTQSVNKKSRPSSNVLQLNSIIKSSQNIKQKTQRIQNQSQNRNKLKYIQRQKLEFQNRKKRMHTINISESTKLNNKQRNQQVSQQKYKSAQKVQKQQNKSDKLLAQRNMKQKNNKTLLSEVINNNNLRLKQMKIRQKITNQKSQKHWKQIDFLRLKTCFYKIQLQINGTRDGKQTEILSLYQKAQKNKNIKTLPKRQNISEFIKTYSMIKEDNMTVDALVKLQKFGVDFVQNQSLYFGQLEGKDKQGFGILIAKHYVYQGFWKNNNKLQGVQYKDGGTFFGKFQTNKREGVGRYVWDNKQQFSGQWKNGLKNGTGHWKNKNGDRYIGQWVNGRVQGYGIHTTQQGQKYQGNFVNFLKEGQGKQSFPNQDQFQGTYFAGKPHGKGKYIFKNGVTYQGDFMNALRHGKGKLKVPNKLVYEGDFKQEQVTGIGKMSFLNGDNYIGQFRNGQMHGKGSMHYGSKNMTLTGVWKNNVYQPIKQEKEENLD